MKSKADIMKKKLSMLKKAMDEKSMDEKDVSGEADTTEDAGGEEDADSNEEKDTDATSESDIMAEHEECGDMDRESLRKYMRGAKSEKKKGVVTILAGAKSRPAEASKSPFQGKIKKA